MINKEILEKTLVLSRLKLDEEQKVKMLQEMSQIIENFTALSELNTEGVEPLHNPVGTVNVWRADKVQMPQTSDEIFNNTPDVLEGQIKVPQVVK